MPRLVAFFAISLMARAQAEEACRVDGTCAQSNDQVVMLQQQVGKAALQPADESGGSLILIIGDSNAQFAGPTDGNPQPNNTLQLACAGSKVNNQAVGGTTASWWLQGSKIETAIRSKLVESDPTWNSGTNWTHVWLSIGGNDLGGTYACGPGGSKKAAIKTEIAAMISKVKNLTSAQIVLTGYPVTGSDDICTLEQMRANVAAAMQEIAASDARVTWASMAKAANGLLDPTERAKKSCYNGLMTADSNDPRIGIPPCRGDKQYFHPDRIHLNGKGYAKAWGIPAIQQAFGCQGTAPPGPPTVAPTPSPTTAGPTNSTCIDDDAGITSYASSTYQYTIPAPGGCKGVLTVASCTDANYGDIVKRYCKKSCNQCQ